MTLYNIIERYENILEVQNELTQGELAAILIDIEDEFNKKAENIVKVIRELDSQKAALENEISRMNDLKKRVETRKAWLNEYLLSNMKRIGVNSVPSDLFTIKIRNNPPSVVLRDENRVPDEFKITKTEMKVDKKALKEFLKNNECDYAYLESKQSLMIK